MRLPTSATSAYHHPLETILGTPTSVRIIRELVVSGVAISQSEIARRTKLNLAGTGRALDRLIGVRIVTAIGQGRTLLYELNRQHPLVGDLINLFLAEEKRVNRVYKAIKQIVRTLSPAPDAVWLFGSVARAEDTVGSDLDIVLVADGRFVKQQAGEMREKLTDLEDRYDVYPSVITLSRKELRDMAAKQNSLWNSLLNDAISLFGPSPKEYLRGTS